MCGICGSFDYKGIHVREQRVPGMVRTLIHRGPDDDGFYFDRELALGMRRLSIIDVAGGHQPIHNEDASVWIVFNGEIYNYPELRNELISKVHSFYTHSDTEVVVHCYEEWGDDCVLRLNGIFAFAIWDRTKRRLLLARDHFGVKPLYYYDDGTRLVWASEIKSLLIDPTIPRQVDLAALDLFLTFRFVPSPQTMFDGIRKLPPGHRLICDDHGCKLERYWNPRPQVDLALNESDYILLLQERLEQAVRRQMISDVPIGALLSGGVDSGVIVAIMSQQTELPVRTFTVGFKDSPDVDELTNARITANLFRTQHLEVVLNSLDYQQLLEKIIWHLDEPIGTTSALAMYCICELAHQHVKVVLTGQGVDEPLAGYPRYLGERYGGIYRHIPTFLRDRVLSPIIESLPRQERIKRAVRSLGMLDTAKRFEQVYAVFTNEVKSALWREGNGSFANGNAAREIINYWRGGVEHLEPMAQMAFVDARLSLADDLLLYGDKMSMAVSVEARVPFLDLDYMAIAEALPVSLRLRGLTHKYIHKKAIAKWLPPTIINRPKYGFDTPVDRWFRSELSGYVRETLLAADSACRNFFNAQAIAGLLHNHMSGRQDNRRQLFSLLMFELWHRQFIDRYDGRD
jgi:asparagine synthase (glutamine-hydrolysing)